MATPNFHTINSNKIYRISVEDTFDAEMRIEDLTELAKVELGFISGDNKSEVIAESYNEFVNKYKTNLTEFNMKSQIVLLCGYYADMNLDYDIEFSYNDDTFKLSDYKKYGYDLDAFAELLYETISDYLAWHTTYDGWNVGTLKIQKKNIIKWIVSLIENESERLEEFCKKHCDGVLTCVNVFSNGEAVYLREVG